MSKELPPTLSVEDAAALILNISYLPGTTNLLDMLSYFRQEAESKLDHADSPGDRKRYQAQVTLFQFREDLARSLVDALDAELTCIREGKESILEAVDDTFGSEKLVTASVCSWAEDMGFGIADWKAPRFWRKASERRHHTEYLAILDDIIATFCEEGGEGYYPNRLPKNDAVFQYVKAKYGDISQKVLSTMTTIIRPGIIETTATKTK